MEAHISNASMTLDTNIMTVPIYTQLYIWNLAPYKHMDCLVQDCIISSVVAMEILQSCTNPSIYRLQIIPVPLGQARAYLWAWLNCKN